MKDIEFIGDAYDALCEMPRAVRQAVGRALNQAQWGDKASYAKVLGGFGSASVVEVRVDDDGDTYRGVYTVEFQDAVYVLHVFKKKSKHGIGLPKRDRELIESRLKLARRQHREQRER